MTNSFLAFCFFLGSTLLLLWTATYGHKIVARARFVRALSELRDEVEDDVFAGVLPDVECVQFFWVKTQVVLDNVEIVSMSSFLANEMVTTSKKKRSAPSVAGLTPPQRKVMHDLDERFVLEMARYVVTGSRMWLLFKVVAWIPLPRTKSRIEHRATQPTKMAEDFNRTLDKSKVRLGGKLAIRPELLVH